MKVFRFLSIAAMALAMGACSNNDFGIDQQPAVANGKGIPFTATISMDNSSTRALTEDGTDIDAAWADGEEVALIYNVGTTPTKTVATVTKQTDDTATISATLETGATDGSDVTIIYPATAADGTTGNVKADLLEAQDGTLTGTGGTSIAENYDVRKGTGKLSISTAGATVNNGTAGTPVSLANQVAIFKFTTKNGDSDLNVSSLTVTIGAQHYVITPTAATNVLYAALPLVTTAQTVIVSATGSDSKNYVFSKNGVTFAASKYYQSTLAMNQGVNLATLTDNYEAQDGDVLTGTLNGETQPYMITIADGATITLDNATINGWNDGADDKSQSTVAWAGLTPLGDATIILKDGSVNSVTGFYKDFPGIFAAVDKKLTIMGETAGTGTLTASSNDFGAGIGGGKSNSCGNIEIQGGVITADGGTGAAGIGSGQSASCGTITISGGTITANGGSSGAGIGSGWENPNPSSCGNITISGGSVTATGGAQGAGIGGGAVGSCGTITISDGTITANGNVGAGIGSGYNGWSDNITISGGSVTATGGQYAAGIGSSYFASCGTITITSDVTSVTVTKGADATYSIGEGVWGACGTVTIGGTEGAITTSPYSYPPAPVALSAVTATNLGWIVGDDGNAYAFASLVPGTVTAVAKIAYVGNDNGEAEPYNHGLALALSDAIGGSVCQWNTSMSDAGHTKQENSSNFTSESGLQYNEIHNTDEYPAFKAAIANNGASTPTGCSAWFLASGYQWKQMANAVGGYDKLGLSSFYYWSSSEGSEQKAWVIDSSSGVWSYNSMDSYNLVRSCLAF